MLLKWFFVLIWAGFIWILSSIPDLSSGLEQDFALRKIAHGLVFGILAILIYIALPSSLKNTGKIVWASLLTFVYAIFDEVHQSFVDGRHGSVIDVSIDTIGVVILLGIFYLVRGRKLSK